MKADLQGALEHIDKYYRVFEHKGKRMTKQQVKTVLEYGIKQGYETTADLSDKEVDDVLYKLNNAK
jgi:hypothetical protein